MPSATVQKVAGTFVSDSLWQLPAVLKWMTQHCRHGNLFQSVERFCREQEFPGDPKKVVVEAVSQEDLHCCIPTRCADHETDTEFQWEMRFKLNPTTGECGLLS